MVSFVSPSTCRQEQCLLRQIGILRSWRCVPQTFQAERLSAISMPIFGSIPEGTKHMAMLRSTPAPSNAFAPLRRVYSTGPIFSHPAASITKLTSCNPIPADEAALSRFKPRRHTIDKLHRHRTRFSLPQFMIYPLDAERRARHCVIHCRAQPPPAQPDSTQIRRRQVSFTSNDPVCCLKFTNWGSVHSTTTAKYITIRKRGLSKAGCLTERRRYSSADCRVKI
ncbi:hypothetical protein BDW62DRAFT_175096 [Aspergillus aurantiobrunneus]